MVNGGVGLFITGTDQTMDVAVMFGAFPDGIDMRIGGLHVVIDDDGAVDRQARAHRQIVIGAHAGTQDHGVTVQRAPVGNDQALDLTRADGFAHGDAGDDLNPQITDARGQHVTAHLIQLAGHHAALVF